MPRKRKQKPDPLRYTWQDLVTDFRRDLRECGNIPRYMQTQILLGIVIGIPLLLIVVIVKYLATGSI